MKNKNQKLCRVARGILFCLACMLSKHTAASMYTGIKDPGMRASFLRQRNIMSTIQKNSKKTRRNFTRSGSTSTRTITTRQTTTPTNESDNRKIGKTDKATKPTSTFSPTSTLFVIIKITIVHEQSPATICCRGLLFGLQNII